MLRHVTRKAAGWLLMIAIATNATYFLASWFLDPRSNYQGLRPVRSEAQIDVALAPYNLDPRVPVVHRWWDWLTSVVLRFDWGKSPTGVSVNGEIGYRSLVSAELVVLATVLSVVVGVALGVYTASRQYGWADRVSQAVSIVVFNIPTSVAALAVVFVAIWLNQHAGLHFLYVAGENSPDVHGLLPTIGDRLLHLILPTLTLTLMGYVGYHLTQRSLLLDTINADFVRTAQATGLTRAQAIRRHALRTALIPTATSVAFSVPAIFTGAIITETIFGWNGMGRYFVQTISKNDVHGAVATAAFAAALTAIGAILADIATVFLDPRVRVS
ncbi:ABC transporter permease [Streptomyces xanthochromogenes]|uniref:ABC transporter permease n=1 Tax=Streptomyces xanthochromogenes TaxID=67384 RepID=A0ABQ2ZJX6_9ACTN|nr:MULTISPECIES: ABC transporter permease [Streptomyces]MYV94137.1 ABC transporter permease subunit [Streptomyces sp. SID1034]GGY18449.1 ABC transporter permease [Streptomyces xanthochromogenes]